VAEPRDRLPFSTTFLGEVAAARETLAHHRFDEETSLARGCETPGSGATRMNARWIFATCVSSLHSKTKRTAKTHRPR
jgi:hypothetical protein